MRPFAGNLSKTDGGEEANFRWDGVQSGFVTVERVWWRLAVVKVSLELHERMSSVYSDKFVKVVGYLEEFLHDAETRSSIYPKMRGMF